MPNPLTYERALEEAIGPVDGKYGLYVGTLDETPSGSQRPRDLLTSQPIYETAEAAQCAGEKLIAQIRTMDVTQ